MKVLIWFRSIVGFVFGICSVIIASALVLLTGGVLGQIHWADALVHMWAKFNTFIYSIKVIVHGSENIPNSGCIFVFNHSSHFDIIALAAGNPRAAHFGAKIELFKIPLFGHALRALGSLPIMRADRDQVFKLYEKTIARVQGGECFYLAAEGTRQTQPGVGAKFKTGPFVFAINGQVPIVPVVIKGAAECLPKADWIACTRTWRNLIQLHFLPPFSTKGLSLDDRQRLVHEVRNLMTKAYDEL